MNKKTYRDIKYLSTDLKIHYYRLEMDHQISLQLVHLIHHDTLRNNDELVLEQLLNVDLDQGEASFVINQQL